MPSSAVKTFAFICLTLLLSGSLGAQGIYLSGAGPVHRGMGGASTAAPISSIGANYWNPATISGIEFTEMEFGVDVLWIDHTVSSTVGANSGSTQGESGTVPVPNVGFVYRPENERITFGLGIQGVAGVKASLPADPTNPVLAPQSAGGLGLVSSEATFINVAPSLSLAINERLSIAAGPILTTAQLSVQPFIFNAANTNATYPSGRATQYRWGGGAQLGMYYITEQGWHYGASIKTPMWMDTFEFYAEDQNGLPRLLTLDVDLPLIVSIGTAYSGCEGWTFAVDGRFFDYANADGWGDPAVFNTTTGALQGLDYSSVFALALGAQKKINDQLYARIGYTYNQNPVKNSEAFFNIASPLFYEHMLSLGGTFMVNQKLGVNVAWSHVFENTRTGPVVHPTAGALPGSSFSNVLTADALSFGIVLQQ